MSPTQQPTPPSSDGTPRPDNDVATRPMRWMQATGFALFIAGGLIFRTSPYSTATWS